MSEKIPFMSHEDMVIGSAFEASRLLLAALEWKSGGLVSAAIEIVKQRDEALLKIKELEDVVIQISKIADIQARAAIRSKSR